MSRFRGYAVRYDDLMQEYTRATWVFLVKGIKLLGSMRVFQPPGDLRARVGDCDYVSALVITASERGRGYAGELLDVAKQMSSRPLVLDVERTNTQGMIAYLKAGFIPIAIHDQDLTMQYTPG